MRPTIIIIIFLILIATLGAQEFFHEEGGRWRYEGVLAGRFNETNIGISNSMRYRIPFLSLEAKDWRGAGLYLDLRHELFLGYSSIIFAMGLVSIPYFRIDASIAFRGTFHLGGYGFLETPDPSQLLQRHDEGRMGFIYRVTPQLGGMIGPMGLGTSLEFLVFDFESFAPEDAEAYFFVPEYGMLATLFDVGIVNRSYLFYRFKNGFSIGIENRFSYMMQSGDLSDIITGFFRYELSFGSLWRVFFNGSVGYYVLSESFSQQLHAEASLNIRKSF